ncbi:MAG: hypothetical protein PHE52_02645 [Candidatus Pacebacteria bacterium]|nr:hypothetical protein [Candidatus Paceibacterota bacterium]
MTATLTSEEAKVLNDVVVEELADFGLMKAVEDKAAAAREIAPKVAKRFESHPLLKDRILLYPISSLETAIMAKIDEIGARCV